MTNKEFKMNMYFEKYKDFPLESVTYFKKRFKEIEDDFADLHNLIVRIQKYQLNKYSDIIGNGGYPKNRHKRGTLGKRESDRRKRRFGNKEERIKKKLYEKHNRFESKGE